MPRFLVAAALALILCACGPSPTTVRTASIAQPGFTSRLEDVLRVRVTGWLAGLPSGDVQVAVRRPAALAHPTPGRRTAPSVSAGEVNGYPCGGDLPPCWVLMRESRGNPDAYNPNGCVWTDKDGATHRGCWGPWQFGTMWAGKLGLPADLSTATTEQWNSAARALWDGGAGCSNWAAC